MSSVCMPKKEDLHSRLRRVGASARSAQAPPTSLAASVRQHGSRSRRALGDDPDRRAQDELPAQGLP
eukprot:3085225-Alexandrium_andersonii.AAC.1